MKHWELTCCCNNYLEKCSSRGRARLPQEHRGADVGSDWARWFVRVDSDSSTTNWGNYLLLSHRNRLLQTAVPQLEAQFDFKWKYNKPCIFMMGLWVYGHSVHVDTFTSACWCLMGIIDSWMTLKCSVTFKSPSVSFLHVLRAAPLLCDIWIAKQPSSDTEWLNSHTS